MYHSIEFLLEIMRKYPPYSINSIIGGVCVCFSAYLDIEIHPKEKITSAILERTVINIISEENYPRQLATAFETLCRFIADDAMLSELHTAIRKMSGKLNLKDMLEALIQNEFLQQLGLEKGTPLQLNKLCVAIIKPLGGSFYDGTAGIGSTAIEAYLYAQSNGGGKLEICTQEIDALCHAVLILRAFLYGIDSSLMHCGNTLTAPKTVLDSKLLQFDYSIMIPPVGLSWKNISHQIYTNPDKGFLLDLPPTSSADWLFVQHQFASLKENGKGIIALPTGALFNAATSRMREAAISAGIIECIITLPPGMLLPYTGIPISLVVISRTKKADTQVMMIQAEGLFDDMQAIRLKDASRLDESTIERICDLYRKGEHVAGISSPVDIDTLAENEWVLLPSRYIRSEVIETEHGRLIVADPTEGDWLPLRSAGSFYRGINVAPSARIDDNGEYRIINLADVQNGEVRPDKLNRYDLTANVKVQNYRVTPGDLLISTKGAVIKTCVVPSHTELVLLSINFIGIHVDQSKFNPLFIKYYLESPAGQVFLRSKQVGTSITTLTARDLEEVLIPVLPLGVQNQYAQELADTENKILKEIESLYTQSKQAKWRFYQNIGLGKIMKKGEQSNDD